jgi:hypothetical protein
MKQEMDIQSKKALTKKKGVWTMLSGLLIYVIDMFTVFPTPAHGPFAMIIGVPVITVGAYLLFWKGMRTSVADVLNLSQELGAKITPAWIVATFGTSLEKGSRLYKKLYRMGFIQTSLEGIETGEDIGQTSMSSDPGAQALHRSKGIEKFSYDEPSPERTVENRLPE